MIKKMKIQMDFSLLLTTRQVEKKNTHSFAD